MKTTYHQPTTLTITLHSHALMLTGSNKVNAYNHTTISAGDSDDE
jgi:hypothetical protein